MPTLGLDNRVNSTFGEGRWLFHALTRELFGLDVYAFETNAPIVITKLFSRDEKNGINVVGYRSPYSNVPIPSLEGSVHRELVPVYALYREAKIATSNYYRFLCYYKIMEGIFNKVRAELMRKARAEGIVLNTRRELVPEHPELRRFYSRYVGGSVKELFDGELTNQYRHAVAHFALNDGTMLNVSEFERSAGFGDIILLTELCVREVVRTQEQYFADFYAKGGRR